MERNKILGTRGELIARQYLVSRGYQLVATNYKLSYPEIDIIARSQENWVFVEVKTRLKNLASLAENPLQKWQTKNLKQAILTYAAKNRLDLETVRLDLIVILVDKLSNLATLKHYPDIF